MQFGHFNGQAFAHLRSLSGSSHIFSSSFASVRRSCLLYTSWSSGFRTSLPPAFPTRPIFSCMTFPTCINVAFSSLHDILCNQQGSACYHSQPTLAGPVWSASFHLKFGLALVSVLVRPHSATVDLCSSCSQCRFFIGIILLRLFPRVLPCFFLQTLQSFLLCVSSASLCLPPFFHHVHSASRLAHFLGLDPLTEWSSSSFTCRPLTDRSGSPGLTLDRPVVPSS